MTVKLRKNMQIHNSKEGKLGFDNTIIWVYFDYDAGGNMVEAVANGNMEIESIKIDPEFAKQENAQLLEVMITSAVNTALMNVKDRIKEEAGQTMSQYGIGL